MVRIFEVDMWVPILGIPKLIKELYGKSCNFLVSLVDGEKNDIVDTISAVEESACDNCSSCGDGSTKGRGNHGVWLCEWVSMSLAIPSRSSCLVSSC